MDPLAIGIIAVALVGVAWLVFRSSDDTDTPAPAPKPEPTRAPGGRRDEPPIPAEAKTPNKLPTAKVLEGMTKAKLEELGREHGVELDKRKTKANMITDLKAGVKAK